MISIVIPHKDSFELLLITLRSIAEQEFTEFEVIIQDGGSHPETIQKLKRLQPGFLNFTVQYEPDESIYHGVFNGFDKCSGQLITYINAGDEFMKDAFKNISINDAIPGPKLIISRRCVKVKGQLLIKPFIKYRRSLAKLGFYGSILPFVQQEGTFFSKCLWENLTFSDKIKFRSFKLAGDYFLWCKFAEKKIKVISLEIPTASFLVHSGQLSENVRAYRKEMVSVFGNYNALKFFHSLVFTIRGLRDRHESRVKKI